MWQINVMKKERHMTKGTDGINNFGDKSPFSGDYI